MDGSLISIILAGGLGKRMKSDLPKVLHPLAGRPLVHHVIDIAREVGSQRTILVIGYKRHLVREATLASGVEWAVQERQLGTADAVRSCLPAITGYRGDILILSGDVPLLRPDTIRAALGLHRRTGAAVTVFTFIPVDPTGYGRVVRGTGGELLRIVEQKDAQPDELKIPEVNGGVYIYRADDLTGSLREVNDDNRAGEFYLTDTVAVLGRRGRRLSAHLVEDPMELAGVNSREQLAQLEQALERRSAG